MSDTEEEKEQFFTCDRCGMSFNSKSQMNAHKLSSHAVAGGEAYNQIGIIICIYSLSLLWKP